MGSRIAPVLVTLVFVGCATTTTVGKKPTVARPGVVASGLTTRTSFDGRELATVITKNCLIPDTTTGLTEGTEIAPLVAALLSAVAPKLIDKGIDIAATKLKAAAAVQTTSLQGHSNDYLFAMVESAPPKVRAGGKGQQPPPPPYLIEPNPEMRCLEIVGLGDGDAAARESAWKEIEAAASSQDVVGQSVRTAALQNRLNAKFQTDGVPVFLAELRMLLAADSSAMRLVPTFMAYRAPLANKDIRGGARTLTVTVTMSGADRKAFFTDIVDLGEWTPGSAGGGEWITRRDGPWIAMPAVPESATKRATEYSLMTAEERTANLAEIKRSARIYPLNVDATVVETQEGRKWLATVAEVLSASKADVTTALTNELPAQKAKADEDQAVTDIGLGQALELALLDERIACEAWAKAKVDGSADLLTKWKSLIDARFKANTAAVKAHQAPHFTNVEQENCDQK